MVSGHRLLPLLSCLRDRLGRGGESRRYAPTCDVALGLALGAIAGTAALASVASTAPHITPREPRRYRGAARPESAGRGGSLLASIGGSNLASA
ncbi:MAG: hypothetical protein JW751_09960 [Polyangiaceae bacterium]|nr:hypothetical protein [Polyangiaceae bacterium]